MHGSRNCHGLLCSPARRAVRDSRMRQAAALRGGRQGRAACGRQRPCAGGGKGRPRPLHPRPGAFAPWNPNLM